MNSQLLVQSSDRSDQISSVAFQASLITLPTKIWFAYQKLEWEKLGKSEVNNEKNGALFTNA